ncbi:MAG: HupE/UreJ family protein, partial [Desulfuromonadaceae bacterium]
MYELTDRQSILPGQFSRYLGFIMLLLIFLTLTASDVFAHGVSEDDKAFIVQSSGMRLLPFIYLGAKHMVT